MGGYVECWETVPDVECLCVHFSVDVGYGFWVYVESDLLGLGCVGWAEEFLLWVVDLNLFGVGVWFLGVVVGHGGLGISVVNFLMGWRGKVLKIIKML